MFIGISITKYHFMYFVFVSHNFKMHALSINNTSHSGWSVICYGRPAALSARLTSGQAADGCAANQTWIRHSRRPKSEFVRNCQWRIVLNWITIWSIQKVLRIRGHYKKETTDEDQTQKSCECVGITQMCMLGGFWFWIAPWMIASVAIRRPNTIYKSLITFKVVPLI